MKPIPVICDENTPIVVIAHRVHQQGYRLVRHRRRVCMVPLKRNEDRKHG